MDQQVLTALHKHRFSVGVISSVVWIVLLSFIISAVGPAKSTSSKTTDPTDSAAATMVPGGTNAVLGTLTQISDNSVHLAHAAQNSIYNVAHSVKTTSLSTAHAAANSVGTFITGTVHGAGAAARTSLHGVGAAFHGVSRGVIYVHRGAVSGMFAVALTPARTAEMVSSAANFNSVLRPVDHDPVPTIDAKAPAVVKATAAVKAPNPALPSSDAPIWPIHGAITTEFGVPEPPYQPIHTGIDISDGQRSGITPIKAFKSGTVKEVDHSGGLGNHVVVDHGNGVTSVYGHMSSTAVTVGQTVDTSTTLGYEGSTGVSTGPHLHFEVRIDDQVANPHLFIPGTP